MSMLITHSAAYSLQMILWPFTYWDNWNSYSKIVAAYKEIWKFVGFVSGVGTIWVIVALVVAGWEDSQIKNHLSVTVGVTIFFYVAVESVSFWFVWTKTAFALLWYEWDFYDSDEARQEMINVLYKVEDEEEEEEDF